MLDECAVGQPGLHRAAVLAPAALERVLADRQVADLAGGAARAAVQMAVEHDPGAEAGADVEVGEAVGVAAAAGRALAERGEVDVVVDVLGAAPIRPLGSTMPGEPTTASSIRSRHCATRSPIARTLAAAAAEVGVTSRLAGFGSTSDAMIFNLYSSTPAVHFGPGDVALAHAPDERVPVQELLKAVEVLALTIVDFCGAGG